MSRKSSRKNGIGRRTYRLIGLVGAILLNAGCNAAGHSEWLHNGCKVGPEYSAPSATVAAEWIDAKDSRTQGHPRRDGDWWAVFEDPVLDALIMQAYQQNPNLRAVGTRVMQARSQQAIAVGNLFPQSQQLTGTYANGTLFGPHAQINTTAFNLSWELDFWGKYRRQVESANAKLEASMDNYDDAVVTLLADVATYYVQYRVAQQRIEIARENLKTQQRLLGIVESQNKIGTSTALDVGQFRTLYEQTRSTLPALQIALGQANDKLCILLGEPPHDLEQELGPGQKPGGLPMAVIPSSAAAGIPADLLRRRPDVRAAERQVAAQNPQIGVAKADFYPSISIDSMLGYGDFTLPPLAAATHGFLAFFTPEFSWKILNYGRIENNVRLQDQKTQEAILTYQNKVLMAAQEVQTALRGFLLSQEQVVHLANSAAAAVSATQIQEKLSSDIKVDVNRSFTLASTQLQVQDQLAVAEGNIALNLIEVYRASGGGWEIAHKAGGVCQPLAAPEASPTPLLPHEQILPRPLPQPR